MAEKPPALNNRSHVPGSGETPVALPVLTTTSSSRNSPRSSPSVKLRTVDAEVAIADNVYEVYPSTGTAARLVSEVDPNEAENRLL